VHLYRLNAAFHARRDRFEQVWRRLCVGIDDHDGVGETVRATRFKGELEA